MLKASIIFLSFNQEVFVEDALISALDQDYGNAEIIIGDDGSSDKTMSIIRQVVSGHPRRGAVVFLPIEENMGLVNNWNRAVNAASGDILIPMAGDDISEPTRVSSLMAIFHSSSGVMAAFSQVSIIDASGRVLHENYEKRPSKRYNYARSSNRTGFDFWSGVPILGACGSYRRELLNVFGPITDAHSEDEPYIYRALLLGDVAYTPENLVRWRWHGLNLSAGSLSDESDAHAMLVKRAAVSVKRIDACRQHAMDLLVAHSSGRLGDKELRDEMRAIDAMKAIHELAYYTLHPKSSKWGWLKAAFKVLRRHRATRRSCAHVMRSFIKRISPARIKVKYSRVMR